MWLREEKIKLLYILMFDKEKVYIVNVIGVNEDWICGWGKEKRCINYDIL